MASEMALVHNALIRGLNAIYLQAGNVASRGSAKDQLDFANFALRWGHMIEEHHASEEKNHFPSINEIVGVPGLMDVNVDEHAVFHVGLVEFLGYVGKVVKGDEKLDGERLRAIIDSFGVALRTHLKNEVVTLKGLEKYEDKTDWKAWFQKAAGDEVMKQMKTSEFRVRLSPRSVSIPSTSTAS